MEFDLVDRLREMNSLLWNLARRWESAERFRNAL